MRRTPRALAAAAALALAFLATACEPPPSPWHSTLISVNAAGTGGGNAGSGLIGVSPDGSQVLLGSSSTDLVAGSTGGGIFLRDLGTGTTTQVWTGSTGTGQFSPDGTKLSLVLLGEDGHASLAVYDIAAGTTDVLVPDIAAGDSFPGSAVFYLPSVIWSADSSKLAFNTWQGLDPSDTTTCFAFFGPMYPSITYNCVDVYVHDLATGVNTMITHNDGRNVAPGPSGFSPDGTKLLLSYWDGGGRGTFLHDLGAGTTQRIGGELAQGRGFAPDGRVVFDDFVVPGVVDTNLWNDVYLHDLATGVNTVISVDATGADTANGNSEYAGMSIDGTKVAFTSLGTDLGFTDTNNGRDLFVRDLTTGTTQLVTTNADGTAATPDAEYSFNGGARFSPDGTKLAFQSWGSAFGPKDTNNTQVGKTEDVYVSDLATGTIQLVSARADGKDSGNFLSNNPRWIDGETIVFDSKATNLGPTVSGQGDVYLAKLHGADLGVSLEGGIGGGGVSYAIAVRNDGPDAGEGASVALALPVGTTFASGSAGCAAPTSEQPRIVVCQLGDLEDGDTANVEVTVTVTAAPGTSLEAAAHVHSTTLDPDTRDNDDEVAVVAP